MSQEIHDLIVGILTARRKAMRNLLGTLLLSAGIPMITAGDEFGRSQRGTTDQQQLHPAHRDAQ